MKWDEVYDLGVIDFLNTLAFIKDREQYQQEQQQKIMKRGRNTIR